MDASVLMNMGGNLATVAVLLTIYVVYKRCVHSSCKLHNSWVDCESDKIKELKISSKKNLYKEALAEYDRETLRYNKNAAPRFSTENRRNVQRHADSPEGQEV
jgi:hypothetical protein